MSETQAITDDELEMIRRQLRGVKVVDVRQVGGDDTVGVLLAEKLRAQGFETGLSHVERIVPSPLRRIGIRFRGDRAEITLTPEVRPNALSPLGRVPL
uniref:hypothetical protein n=1 Tax=Paenirhodobacter enshiensis TaxID=1105367 RepID=UPI0035B48254